MWISLITTLATKLPLAALERWLTHLEKKDSSENVRLIEILKELLETKKLQAQIVIAEQDANLATIAVGSQGSAVFEIRADRMMHENFSDSRLVMRPVVA